MKCRNLTKREREIVGWLAEGFSNDRIAQHMNISRATVRNHLLAVSQKWGTSSRNEVVYVAYQLGLVN